MSYSQDLHSSARRTLKSAQVLFKDAGSGNQPDCKAVAGYLFGLAGELAVKQIMKNSGMKSLKKHLEKPKKDKGDKVYDPFFEHFPKLKSLLKENINGRRSGTLLQIANNEKLFQNWNIKMRYAPTSDIQLDWVNAWKASAEKLFLEMNKL